MIELAPIDWSQLGANAITAAAMISFAYILLQAAKIFVDMMKHSMSALNDTQVETRAFYVSKLEDMRAEMRRLEARVVDLEEQVREKNERIEELERENQRLHHEIEALRVRLDGSAKLAAD